MKKLQKVRTNLLVAVSGVTATSVVVLREQLVAALFDEKETCVETATCNSSENMLFIVVIVIAVMGALFLFNWLTTRAFSLQCVRKFFLKRDYVEGNWLVDNKIDGHVVSTGLMHYQIANERLEVTGTHFPTFGGGTEQAVATESIAADCFYGKYYNHFRASGGGLGVANGRFSSTGRGGSIPDRFDVDAIITTPPASIFEWGRNAPNWLSGTCEGFLALDRNKKIDLIEDMSLNKVATMHQHGIRISKEELDKAKQEDSKNYRKNLSLKHYEDISAKPINPSL